MNIFCFIHLSSWFPYWHGKDLLLSQQDGDRINDQNLEDLKNRGWIWDEDWKVEKTIDIGAEIGTEKWGKETRGKISWVANQDILWTTLTEGRIKEMCWAFHEPQWFLARCESAFLLEIIGRTEILYTCCIILSFQHGKNHWPHFIDVRRKGHELWDMLWKGRIKLLLPKDTDSFWPLCLGKSYFLQRSPGKKENPSV